MGWTKKIKIKEYERGLSIGDFNDANGESCSIQKSSVATEDMIWLGRDGGTRCRMHLDQELASALIPLLKRFVKTGELED